jgi:hypothetical protein
MAGDVTVTQQKLVMNAFAAIFQNNLVSKDLVTWRKFEGEMNDRNGLQVIEQVAPRYVVTETTDGVRDLSSGVQDSVFGSEIYKVNKTFGASMGWGDFVKIRDVGEARESIALRQAALQMCEAIDKHILGVASTASAHWLGTPANGIDEFGDVVQGYTRLKEMGVMDDNIKAVLTYKDKEDLGETVIDFAATDQLSTGAFRNGFTGAIGGIPTLFTQQLPNYSNGNDVTGVTVDGANQEVNYSAVAASGAPGQHMSQEIDLQGFTANTGTLAAGSVFEIDNVDAWDNRAQQSLGRAQQFTVLPNPATADGSYTADGNGDIVARIYPAMIVQGTSDVNTAHATVDAAPAGSAALTFVGSASTVYLPRLLLDKAAINVCTADLIMPASDTSMRKALTKLPLSVRMWQKSDFATGEHSIRFDVALTANIMAGGRDRIVRINGNSA